MSDCQSKLQGRCEGSVQAQCSAQCMGTTGSASCMGSCQASCSGSCHADASIKCNGYLHCQYEADASCEANLNVMCSASCSASGGVLVCNGKVVSFQSTIDDAKAWLEAHGYASGSAMASCSGTTCEADAQGSAGVKCSTMPGGGGGSMLAAGILGLAYGASRIRRKKQG
jgi:MYXO-CTERM domain-containing protein